MNKIIELRTENIKKISAVTVSPDGASVVVSGENAQGKSSIIDSIMYALKGKKSYPPNVINDDADKAVITINMTEYIVERTINRSGKGSLKITCKDGGKVIKKQGFLDDLCGKNGLAYDPIEFTRKEGKDQLSILKGIVGICFDDLDARYDKEFEERKIINRTVASLKGAMENDPYYPDAPPEEVSFMDLQTEYDDACNDARELERMKADEDIALASFKMVTEEIAEACVDIDALIRHKEELIEKKAGMVEEGIQLTKDIEAMERGLVDPAPIKSKMANAEDTNIRVRANRDWMDLQVQHDNADADSKALTQSLKDIKETKEERLKEAKFPVAGLSFGEEGILYKGQPFEQASQAEQIRVSVGISAALNPGLRIAIVRDGSLLDEKSTQMLLKMANENDLQLWIEKVAPGSLQWGLLIEEGDAE